MDRTLMERIEEITQEAGFDEDRSAAFWQAMEDNPDLLEELTYYLENNAFLCKATAAGLSIVDVMVWQIDHFRAYLDRDTRLTRNNPRTMGLLAVETMAHMRKAPEKYLQGYTGETGIDRLN